MAGGQIGIGVIGLGTVGGGVVELLREKAGELSAAVGAELRIVRAADLEPARATELGLGDEVFTTEAWSVVHDREVDIVVELIGGLSPARELVVGAIEAGKQVVTANKALLASHGAEIFALARERGVGIGYEASVGGGIPLIRALREGLIANRITRALGILNGTCNYILTEMTARGADFADVLAEAQRKGYAEADPSFDVEGTDTAHKLAIVAALASGAHPRLEDIYVEGITALSPVDIHYAQEFGFCVKLLAIFSQDESQIHARVHPALVPQDHPLAAVQGPFNALFLEGDWVGPVLLYGQGAGRRPTASAVVGDIVELAREVATGCTGRLPPLGTASPSRTPLVLAPMEEVLCQYYFRFMAADRPGVLAAISRVLGAHRISIKAVIQKGRRSQGPVPIVMLTHEAPEAAVRKALREIDALEVIAAPTVMLRVVS